MLLIIGLLPGGILLIALSFYLLFTSVLLAPVPLLLVLVYWNFIYHAGQGGVETEKYLVFNDDKLRKTYATSRYPMCELYEDFIDGKIDWNPDCEGGDCLKILDLHRDEFVNYKTTWRQIKWLLVQFIPPSWLEKGHGQASSSYKDKDSTRKEIAEHYDRGNDFFNAFLGPSMVYTCGIFHNLDQSLETAQFNKMNLICEKLELQKGERFLDIGCGWGTLTRHAVKEFGATGTGVTLSKEGKAWCVMKNKEEKVDTNILCMDYRDIPKESTFNKIASIEMAEHVGCANFVDPYMKGVRRLLEDDGLFLLQVAGLRQGSNWQDLAWALFMGKYIFPGADASTPLNWYVRQVELAGFEVHSVETIGRHYSHTLHKWYDNWMVNQAEIVKKPQYDTRLCRLWEIFLAWSVIASGQGSATCYQILCHKNLYDYPRDRWCDVNMVSNKNRVGTGVANHMQSKKVR